MSKQANLFGRQCTVCRSPARSLIDGALIAGESVSSVYDTYGNPANLSSAALYRHRRGLHHAPKPLASALPGERPSDLVAALVGAVETARNVKRDAEARGSESVALRAAGEIRQGVVALAERLGITDESAVERLDYAERIIAALRRGTALDPSLGDLLAAGAADAGDKELAADASDLADRARKFFESKEKES